MAMPIESDAWKLTLVDGLLRTPYKHMSQLAEKIKHETSVVDSEKITDIILHYVLLGDFLNRCYKENKLMDATVDIGKNYSFDSHSLTLACHSEFFFHHILGTDQGDDDIFLEDMHPDTFKHVLTYMYSGQVSLNVSNIIDVHHLAFQLKIHTLIETCLNFVRAASADDAVIIMEKARKGQAPSVYDAARQIVVTKFTDVVKSRNFLFMEQDAVCELLSDSNILINTEIAAFDAALTWLKYDLEARKEQSNKVLSCVRFQFIKPNELVSCMDILRNLLGSAVSDQVILGASWFHTCQQLGKDNIIEEKSQPRKCLQAKPEPETLKSAATTPVVAVESVASVQPNRSSRKPTESASKASASNQRKASVSRDRGESRQGDFTQTQSTASASKSQQNRSVTSESSLGGGFLIPTANAIHGDGEQWQCVTTLPARRNKYAVAYMSGFIYMLGGSDGNTATNSVFKYDGKLQKWLEVAPMKKKRINPQTAVMGDHLYVLGGQDEEGRILASFERYNSRENTWMRLATANIARVGAAMAPFRGELIVAGGYSINKNKKVVILDAVEGYNPIDGAWSLHGKLRFPRYHASMVEVRNKLMLCGGVVISTQKGSPTPISIGIVDSYVPEGDTWKYEAEMRMARHKAGIATQDDKMFIMGGLNAGDGKAIQTVESFNVTERIWTISQEMPSIDSAFKMITLPASM